MPQGNAYNVLEKYVQLVYDALSHSLAEHDKIASGALVQSIKVYPTIYGQKISLVIEMADYWKYVDKGRKAGGKQPPQEAMLKHIANRGNWHVKKINDLQKFRKNSKGQIVQRKKLMPIDKARKSLAFLIGRGIKKHGIKPTNFATDVFEGNTIELLKKDLQAAIGRDIEIEIQTELDL